MKNFIHLKSIDDLKKANLWFNPDVCKNLKYYVYAYYNPDVKRGTKEDIPFYVGKGQNNRCFMHLINDNKNEKSQFINRILTENKYPRIEILRYGIENEKEAYAIEATLIDAFWPVLTNKHKGHGSSSFGKQSILHLNNILSDADEIPLIDLPEDSLIVRINRSYKDGITLPELYDITRGCWRIASPIDKKIKYVISVYQGIIKQVFIPEAWLPAESTMRNNYDLNQTQSPKTPDSKKIRWEFVGHIAYDKQDIVGKWIGCLDSGAQNPCIYTNTLLKTNNEKRS